MSEAQGLLDVITVAKDLTVIGAMAIFIWWIKTGSIITKGNHDAVVSILLKQVTDEQARTKSAEEREEHWQSVAVEVLRELQTGRSITERAVETLTRGANRRSPP